MYLMGLFWPLTAFIFMYTQNILNIRSLKQYQKLFFIALLIIILTGCIKYGWLMTGVSASHSAEHIHTLLFAFSVTGMDSETASGIPCRPYVKVLQNSKATSEGVNIQVFKQKINKNSYQEWGSNPRGHSSIGT